MTSEAALVGPLGARKRSAGMAYLDQPNLRQKISQAPDLSGPMIRILVGDEEKEYCAHRYYLVMTSRFFRAALAKPWEENQGTVRLPEQKPEAFARYLHYAYHDVITTKPEVNVCQQKGEEGHLRTQWDEFEHLIEMYFLADYIQAEDWKNAIADAFMQKVHRDNAAPLFLIKRVYRETTSRAPLRRMIVDYHVWIVHGKAMEFEKIHLKATAAAFWEDVARAFMAAGKSLYEPNQKKPWEINRCLYHEHESTEKCTA